MKTPTFVCLLATLLVAIGVHAAPAQIEDTMAQRLVACTVCHGAQGRAAPDGYHPPIAGKPAGYLFNQLQNFQQGRRHYGPMVALVDPLPEPLLLQMAQHFAALVMPYAPQARATEPATVLERGRTLALQGDATRQLPACSACHGRALTGVQPATPGLLGLPRDYLVGQLGAWVNGQRRAHAPDCMAAIAKRLVGSDITAVSAWLAGQSVPVPSSPAPAAEQPAPLRCGGAP